MSTSVRKQAPRIARPAARYWKGKLPKGVADVQSDSEEEEEQQEVEEEGDVFIGGEQDIVTNDDDEDIKPPIPPKKGSKGLIMSLKDVNVSKDGSLLRKKEESEESEEESEEDDEAPAKVALKPESDESSEYETDSEEESEEEKPKLQFRPQFVPKRNRATIQERDAMAEDVEEAEKRKEAEAEERRKQSHDLVAESIRRELAEKEKEEEVPDLDDTDGLDPEGEFEAWRLRELGRIKKEKEAQIARDEELAEIERRRAMPEDQRMKEDMEHAQKLREEKPKGQQKFLQKYWHKGAFHQDEEILKRHDFTEATESTVDVSLLPKVMQKRNFGKRSQTKYTHLLDQDTTVAAGGFGGAAPVRQGGTSMEGGGCFLCGGPHLKKDCPQTTGPLSERDPPQTGANGAPVGPRSTSWRVRDDVNGRYKNSDRGRDRGGWDSQRRSKSRSPPRRSYRDERRRSRSRSPPPYRKRSRSPPPRRRSRERDDRRRRSRERSIERDYRDKRRRVD